MTTNEKVVFHQNPRAHSIHHRGFETTSITLGWAWYLLSKHPEVLAKLVRELDAGRGDPLDLEAYSYKRHVLDEVLRLYPAGWLFTRKALTDDQVGDYFIPVGTEIYIPPTSFSAILISGSGAAPISTGHEA